jgi:hypothetical protein
MAWHILRILDMEGSHEYIGINTVLTRSIGTTAWHILMMQMEETASRYGGWL